MLSGFKGKRFSKEIPREAFILWWRLLLSVQIFHYLQSYEMHLLFHGNIKLSREVWPLVTHAKINNSFTHLPPTSISSCQQQIQSTLAFTNTSLLRKPRYYGKELKTRGIRITGKYLRYYGLSLLRTPNRGPDGVRYNESWLYCFCGCQSSWLKQSQDAKTPVSRLV